MTIFMMMNKHDYDKDDDGNDIDNETNKDENVIDDNDHVYGQPQ